MLNQKEYLLLLTLLRSPSRPMEKEALYAAVWGADPGGDLSALYTAISRATQRATLVANGKLTHLLR